MRTMEALKILLLEDSPEDAEIVERLLRKTIPGNIFCLVMNKAGYVKALDEFQPDIILSDNNLPMFNAQEALTIIQERSLYVPFILVTGTVSDEFAANIIKAGADDYILKDRLTRLPVAIEGALRRQQLKKERSEAIEQLRSSEEKYRTLFLRSPVPKWIYDFETLRFLEVNEAAIEHYGYSAEEFQNMTLRDIRPTEELPALEDDLERIPSEHEARKSNWIHFKKNGERIIVETTAQFIEYQDRKARIVVINDITERVRAEEALRAMEMEVLNQKIQEQKKVTRAIIKAQENERNHIGRELHDNVNQILVSTKIYLGVAADDNESMRDMIGYPLKLIDNAIQEIRELTHGYVAPTKNIDLYDVVDLLMEGMQDNYKINTAFVYDLKNLTIDDELKLNIYRIIQEQTNNIVKHAAAKNVNVSITSTENNLLVRVADDGKGFDPEKKRKGIGIFNMLNRIESFNGEMKIESAPGKGTSVQIIIPLEE